MSVSLAKKLWLLSLKTSVENLDTKHTNIITKEKRVTFDQFERNFRNWSAQSDFGIPFQFNLYSLKSYGLLKYLRYLIAKVKCYFLYGVDDCITFFDDLSLIKLVGGYDILKSCPIHKTPGNNLAYFINNKTSANFRWLRYIYFSSIIRSSYKNKKNPEIFLDIGSYYGGFQYVIKKIYPDSFQILVDFPHQLSRSALFLSQSFPKMKIFSIYDQPTFNEFFQNSLNEKYDFLLLSAEYYSLFSEEFTKNNRRIDLLTNFYSLGEMSTICFNSYLDSKLIKNAKKLYFCNRYDSSPFYEKTFDVSYSLLDYIVKNFSITLNRSSGIHHYLTPVRKVFGVTKPRPISSGYFDLIQENNL